MGLFGKSGGVISNGYDNTLTDNTLYGSKVINGNNVSVFTMRAMYPSQAAAPYMYGNGSKPATLAGFSPSAGTSGLVNMTTGIGGGPSGEAAGENPWNLQVSPTGWAVAFLVIGFLGLRHIHWRAE